MVQTVEYVILGIGVLCIVGWLIGKVAAQWPGSVPSGVVTVADKVSVYTDQTAGVAAWATLKALAAKRGDEELKAALDPVWVRIGKWDDPVEPKP